MDPFHLVRLRLLLERTAARDQKDGGWCILPSRSIDERVRCGHRTEWRGTYVFCQSDRCTPAGVITKLSATSDRCFSFDFSELDVRVSTLSCTLLAWCNA
jgi:hypothetical protein